MRELGWVEGRNVTYDRVYAEGDETRLPELGGQLVARKADLLYVTTNPEALAVQGKTRTIPIVFSAVAGPVEIGLVKSLARPGGNATGVANIGWELGGKRMQLLKQVLPNLRRVGVLVVPNTPSAMNEPQLIGQAAGTGVEVMAAYVKDGELGTAFASLAQRQVEAVLMTHSVIFMRQRKRVLELASKLRIPVIGHRSEIAEAGALLSYSSILLEQVRASARIADKILKGARPADIPVERPVKFELVVNLKTANALGITVPQSVLLQADRVIE
jgi:putative ABC transport system substrate-binding protein